MFDKINKQLNKKISELPNATLVESGFHLGEERLYFCQTFKSPLGGGGYRLVHFVYHILPKLKLEVDQACYNADGLLQG